MADPNDDLKKPAGAGVSRNVIVMGTVSFLNDLSSDMIFPFIPVFLTSVLGAPVAFVGVVEGVADATASILKMVSGRYADILRRRKPFIVGGYALSALAKPLLAFAAAPWHVLAVRFIDRTGKGMRDAPRDALLSMSTEKQSVGRAFGFHRAADTLGAAAGPMVAFLLLPWLGNDLRMLFLFSFVASFVAVVILQIFVRDRVQSLPQNLAVSAQSIPYRSLGAPFYIFLTAAVVLALGRASDAFLILRAQDAGIALALLPLPYVLSNLVFSAFAMPVGSLSDRIGHRNTFMMGIVLLSVVYMLFARTHSLTALWALFALYGCANAFVEGVGRAIVADIVAEGARGTAYGLYNACTGIALLPASVLFGFLWQYSGFAAAFIYSAVLGGAAFCIFLFLRIRYRRMNHI
ncbi:MAG: MFS transporter [Candidatus Sungbacteria bacterium]|nr:MFS transporter [Candidatus Sungbacteria bacterium]